MAIILSALFLASVANAQAIRVHWQGPVSFPIKSTSAEEDASGNMKLFNSVFIFSGVIKLDIGITPDTVSLIPDTQGCYVVFLSQDPETNLCIKKVGWAATDNSKSKTDQLLAIGTGDLTTILETGPATGSAYIDTKGTIKKGTTAGSITSISLNGKLAGEVNGDTVFNGTFRSTLLPVQ
jgi:hypothetical protein